MATRTVSLRMKPYIQPFERVLAMQEVKGLTGKLPAERPCGDEAETFGLAGCPISARELANRLAYWEVVEDADRSYVTTQSLRESTVNVVRNGIDLDELRELLPFSGSPPLPNRRCLRYGTHGVHEYRGKFFPQLVRSLINASSIAEGCTVGDPMCGSGTTLVESVLAGMKAKGIDMNPLSVLLAHGKTELLRAKPQELVRDYDAIRRLLVRAEPRGRRRLRHFESLPSEDQHYLRSWFAEDVLSALDDIAVALGSAKGTAFKTLGRLALSNIVRSVSWQKVEDLRVRKEIRLDVEVDAKKEFLEEVSRSIRAVLAFLYQNGTVRKIEVEAAEGDARQCQTLWGRNSIDLIITSPPYATALPYLDTDRLSLCYLGLLPRPKHRTKDQLMIGNREVTERLRSDYWKRYTEAKDALPRPVSHLIDTVHELNSNADVGFRRRNLASLLAKYFLDMTEVMIAMKAALKPGRSAYVVVGNNHTIAGGHRIEILTAELLEEIGKGVGFQVYPSIPMEMLVSRDIFKKNASDAESILTFRKPRRQK